MDPETRPEGVSPEGAGPEPDAGAGPPTEPVENGSTEGAGPAGPAGAPAGPDRPAPEHDPGPHRAAPGGGSGASDEPGGEDEYDHAPTDEYEDEPEREALAEEDTMAATLLGDLQRLQAEYVNYKKRVDRDREVIRVTAVNSVVESLLPVLDEIYLAREAGDLDSGPFAAIADKLEGILQRYGIVRVGESGEEFDPTIHEAMMHVEAEVPEGATGPTVVQVFQPGYRNGDRLVRAARVSVADPA